MFAEQAGIRQPATGVIAAGLLGSLALGLGFGFTAQPVAPIFALAGVAICALALFVRPGVFVAGAVLVLGTYQLSIAYPIQWGSVSVYTSDLLVALVLLRAAMPYPRAGDGVGLGRGASALALLWLCLLVVAGLRGAASGGPLDVAIRDGMAVVYLPVFYLGFSRILREEGCTLESVIKPVAVVIVGFVTVALASRAVNQPLSIGGASGLAYVPTASGPGIMRDFGFATSFFFFPVLAVAAFAYVVHAGRASLFATTAMLVGIVGTLSTLVRGQIFALAAGALAVLTIRAGGWGDSRRLAAVAQIAGGLVCVALFLAVISPSLLGGAVERALPGVTPQATKAVQTAEFRRTAASAGVEFAAIYPWGRGFVPPDTVSGGVAGVPAPPRSAIDAAYAAHSTVAWLLYFTGWAGLLLMLIAWGGVLVRSFRAPGRESWFHPAFVGIWVAILVNGAAASIFQQPFVLGIAALAVAIRFGTGLTVRPSGRS